MTERRDMSEDEINKGYNGLYYCYDDNQWMRFNLIEKKVDIMQYMECNYCGSAIYMPYIGSLVLYCGCQEK